MSCGFPLTWHNSPERCPTEMKFTTSYVQTLSRQFQAMTSFAKATDLAGLQQTWPMTQNVLETNGVEVPGSDELPSYDVDIPAFQRLILGSVRPNLSDAVIALLAEPLPQGIALVKKTPVEHIEAINGLEILTETAGSMMMMSAEIYLKLGIRLDTAATYFMSKGPVSNELLWQMRVLFAINDLSIDFLKNESANTPHTNYAYSAALIAMIKSRLEPQLVTLLTNESSSTLTRDHAITPKGVDRAHEARLISSTTKERADKVLRPTLIARLSKMFRK
jgi:hypothetical protein